MDDPIARGRQIRAVLADRDIRPALLSRLMVQHSREVDTVVLEELGLCRGQVRVDLAVVNGLIHGYEIKSDRDSLRRLVGQVDLYSRVLDRATLVVGERHLPEALEIVPMWWGILRVETISRSRRFKTVRRGRQNPGRDARSLVELLWLDDAVAMLERRHAARGIKGKPRRAVWDRVCEHFDVNEIAAAVRTHLKARATQSACESASNGDPRSQRRKLLYSNRFSPFVVGQSWTPIETPVTGRFFFSFMYLSVESRGSKFDADSHRH
jgi:hypothetical protein